MEGLAEGMFLGDAGEGGGQDDDGQADQADGGQVQGQPGDQPERDQGLDDQLGLLLRGALGIFVTPVGFHDAAHGFGQLGAIAKPAALLHQDAGEQATEEDRDGHRGHANGELAKMPAGLLPDDEVLWFTHQGADAPERRPDGGMHHQAAQEAAKLIQMLAGQLVDPLVIVQVAGLITR
ncbi:hypothetical protein D3C85_1149350 [compost metagenome]